jgi:hypothetical protein
MTADDQAPDWRLLPHDPQAFFALPDEFDRKDLKRAYNRFLRQFKPEKHPAEFQRIRAAFEALDNRLRYGESLADLSQFARPYEWQTDASAAAPAPSRSSNSSSSPATPKAPAAVPAAPPLAVRVRQQPLPALYRELAEKPRKSPYDFYSLAILSDVVQRKDGLQFVRWLLQGLAEHPRDQALLCLLYEYLRGPLPMDAATKLLAAVAKTLRSDQFYAVTEDLWQRVLRERPFAEFRAALAACQTELRDVRIDCRLAFTVEILKSAIWTADQAWIDEAFRLIEENFERVPPQLQYDLDILDLLRRYIAGRPKSMPGRSLRAQIDEAIRNFFTADQATRDRSVLRCQIAIAEDPNGTLDAFPLVSDEDYSNFYILWNFVTADVAERHAEERPETNVKAWASRGQALFQTIERGIEKSRARKKLHRGMNRYYTIEAVMLVGVALIAVLPSAGIVSRPPDEAGLSLLISVVLGVVFGGLAIWAHFRYLRPRMKQFDVRQKTACYAEVSRVELAAFLQRSQFTRQELHELVFSLDIRQLPSAQSTADHFQQDYALAIYAMATRFQV